MINKLPFQFAFATTGSIEKCKTGNILEQVASERIRTLDASMDEKMAAVDVKGAMEIMNVRYEVEKKQGNALERA